MTIVELKPRLLPVVRLFDRVTQEQVDSISISDARDVWHELGGPSLPQWLLTKPDGSAKSRKSSLPEYMLYLLPHKLAGGMNLCRWSNAGCRKNCLVSAGRGAQPNVHDGRMARTRLLFEHPDMFLALLQNDLRRIERKHGTGGAWVRLNGTSDIPWEDVLEGKWIAECDLKFADYTKAHAHERPQPDIWNYKLSRSVWPGRHEAIDVADLLEAGERVSMVTEDPSLFEGMPFVVMADKTDEWLLEDSSSGVLGLLSPKGKLRFDPDNYFTNETVRTIMTMAGS